METLTADELCHIAATWADLFTKRTMPPPKYQSRGRRKLTEDDVRSMRETWATWRNLGCARRGFRALGSLYGVSMWTARDVIEGRTWSHVA